MPRVTTSPERPESPASPDSCSSTRSRSSTVRWWRSRPTSAPGSIEPARVAIGTPSSGAKPIVVSIERQICTAVTEQPPPRWQTITAAPGPARSPRHREAVEPVTADPQARSCGGERVGRCLVGIVTWKALSKAATGGDAEASPREAEARRVLRGSLGQALELAQLRRRSAKGSWSCGRRRLFDARLSRRLRGPLRASRASCASSRSRTKASGLPTGVDDEVEPTVSTARPVRIPRSSSPVRPRVGACADERSLIPASARRSPRRGRYRVEHVHHQIELSSSLSMTMSKDVVVVPSSL